MRLRRWKTLAFGCPDPSAHRAAGTSRLRFTTAEHTPAQVAALAAAVNALDLGRGSVTQIADG